MKRINIIALLLLVLWQGGRSQTVLEQIEQNNTILSALRKQADAEKIGNRTGLNPENPEVEFAYLWGNKAIGGNRTDMSVTQSFDFPTAYHYKRKVADEKNKQVDLKYLMERKDILLQAQQLCTELTYQNALHKNLSSRLHYAESIANAYGEKYKTGESNVLDFNRAKLNLSSARKELSACQIDRDYLLAELARLNGGIAIDYTVLHFEPVWVSPDFETLYAELRAKNLSLLYLQQETVVSKESEKLQRSLNLPKLSAGYMSEKVMTEHFQGVAVGVSIPLWENKNTVRQLRAQTLANQATEEDANLRYRNEASALHKKATHLLRVVADYKANALSADSSELLKKALDLGEVSLTDFILEMDMYLDVSNGLLEAERDLQHAIEELYQYFQ